MDGRRCGRQFRARAPQRGGRHPRSIPAAVDARSAAAHRGRRTTATRPTATGTARYTPQNASTTATAANATPAHERAAPSSSRTPAAVAAT